MIFLEVTVDERDLEEPARSRDLRRALIECALKRLDNTALDEYEIVGIQWEASAYMSPYSDLRPYARVEVIARKKA